MLIKLKNWLFNTDEKKRLVSNVFSLSVLQASNYILPFLTVPYLVRILGPENFGLLAFVSATTIYFSLIADYGFNLSATRQISICRYDAKKTNEIFSSVMIVKSGLLIFSFLLLILLVLCVDKFNRNWAVYCISFITVAGQALFPVWFFQGMERMRYITYLNVATKAIFTLCVFIFVRNEADYLLVPLIGGLGSLVAGIGSLYLVKKNFDVRFALQPINLIFFQLREGWHVFFSSIAVSLYTVSTTFILGLVTNNAEVGYFAAADKIVQAVKGLYAPLSQAIYPLVGKKMHEDGRVGLNFVKKIMWVVGPVMLLASFLLFCFAKPIVIFMFGIEYESSILLLKIIAFLPFVIFLSNLFGIQVMLNLGHKKAFSQILFVSAIVGVCLSFLMIPLYKNIASAAISMFVEILVTIMMLIFLKTKIGKLTR